MQADLSGVVERVVDSDKVDTGRVEQGRGDRGAVARAAVDPDRPVGDLGESGLQLVEWDVDGAVDVAAGPLVVAAGVAWPPLLGGALIVVLIAVVARLTPSFRNYDALHPTP